MPFPLIAWAAIAVGTTAAGLLGYKLTDDSTDADRSREFEAQARREAESLRQAEEEVARECAAREKLYQEQRRKQALEGGLEQLRFELKPLGIELLTPTTLNDMERFARAQPDSGDPQNRRIFGKVSQITSIPPEQLNDFGLLLDNLQHCLNQDPRQHIASQMQEIRKLQKQFDTLSSIHQLIEKMQRS